MEFDPEKASPCFANQPTESRQPIKHFDPWTVDPFMGTKPKPVPDVFNQVDYRDYDFLRFAKDEARKPRQVAKQKYIDPLFGERENTIGQSSEDE